MTKPDAVLAFSSILIIFLHFQVHVPLLPDAVLAVGQTTIAVAEENALPVLRLALQEKIYFVFWKIKDPLLYKNNMCCFM